MANPVCFFDMTVGGAAAGRIEMTVSDTSFRPLACCHDPRVRRARAIIT